MGTNVRRNLSTKSRYYISKHRRLELEHFCLQYYEWKEELLELTYVPTSRFHDVKTTNTPDPTMKTALRAIELRQKMEMVEQISKRIDISEEIFTAVTKGVTFSYFEARQCYFGRDLFYDRLRQFYFLLDKIRR